MDKSFGSPRGSPRTWSSSHIGGTAQAACRARPGGPLCRCARRSNHKNPLFRGIRYGKARILFGSDWPNSDGVAPIDKVFAIATAYFLEKPRPLAEKYFWKNSVAVYNWVRRAASEPTV
jgi:hypothetical protein